MLKENDKIGIVACSNALPIQAKSSIHELEKILKRHQLEPVFSQYIYQTKDLYSGTGQQKAMALLYGSGYKSNFRYIRRGYGK